MASQSDNPTSYRVNARISKMAACMRRLNYSGRSSSGMVMLVMETPHDREPDPVLPDMTLLPVTEFGTEREATSVWEQLALNLN